MLNYSQIKELIGEIDSSSLRVFELESEGIKLKLSKNEETSIKEVTKEAVPVKSTEVEIVNNISKGNSINISNDESIIDDSDLNIVKSPLVGTYYSSATPGGKSYVEVGSKIKKGQVLCIVEAMKIMNEITSEFDGEVVEVLRVDEDIVEFGMPLFKIK